MNCGDTIDFEVGNTIVFYAGGYTCIGDSLCTSEINWTMNGPVTGSGTGYPTFNFSVAGSYTLTPVSYTHLRAHETVLDIVCRLLLENKKNIIHITTLSYTNYYTKHAPIISSVPHDVLY